MSVGDGRAFSKMSVYRNTEGRFAELQDAVAVVVGAGDVEIGVKSEDVQDVYDILRDG